MPFKDGTPTKDEILVTQLDLVQPFNFIDLRPHQLVARHFALQRKRVLIGMDKGLGKTLFLYSVTESYDVHRDTPGWCAIILTTKRGMEAYERDIQKFPNSEGKIQLVRGSIEERRHQWRNPDARYFICTYAGFRADIGMRLTKGCPSEVIVPKWVQRKGAHQSYDAFVMDEFHRVLRRRQSSYLKIFKPYVKDVEYFIPMSGSPTSRGPQDIWPTLHLIDPKRWSSYWKFCYAYCDVQNSWWGQGKTVGDVINEAQFRKDIAPYVFNRRKDDVGNAMVDLTKQPMTYMPPAWQKKLVNSLLHELWAETENGDILLVRNKLQAINKVRLALICPKALDLSFGIGGGIEEILEDVQDSELDRFAIATPFKAPIPHLKAFLEENGIKVFVLTGDVSNYQKSILDAWRNFQATKEKPCCMIYTIQYGESWEIPEASYGYLLGYEWDPEVNDQAISRTHRLISENPNFWYYVIARGTYEEDHIQLLTDKVTNTQKSWNGFVEAIIHANDRNP